ncbi:MAG TPA: Ig-like domain-containing protein, partial [Chryseolinea sp.]|nr:Ig-like domain-containing protein [Chryseolinea sp.]
VTILSPQPNSRLAENFIVDVSANAANGISKVELYLDNVMIGRADAPPYEYFVNITGYSMGDYILKAVAYSNAGATQLEEISITILKSTIPAPLEFTATKGRYGNKVALTWNKSPGVTHYEIYKLDNFSLQYGKIATVESNTFEDNAIESPLTQFFYKVRAYNSDAEFSEFSDHDYGYTSGEPYDLITSFGREGTNNDEFGMIVHLSYHNNELFLADDYRQRVVAFNKEGNFIRVHQLYNGYPLAPYFFGDKRLNIYNNTIMVEEGPTTLNSFVADLIGIRQATVDDENHIYVAASNSNKIAKYDMQGNLILQWGVEGDLPGQFNASWGIAFFHDNIVVSNYFSKKVQFFSKSGVFIKEWVFADAGGTFNIYVKDDFLYIACGNYIAKTDYDGLVIEKIYGLFTFATGIAVDEDENIFVTDAYQRKIYAYRKND